MRNKLLIITIILTVFCSNIGFSDVNFNTSLYKAKIIGLWNFDIEAYMQTDEYLEQAQGNPETEEIIKAMLEMMVIEFTPNSMSITANVFGEVQEETSALKIVSEEGNKIIIENTDMQSDISGEQLIIIILDDNHLQLMPVDPAETEDFFLYLVRAM